MKKANYEKHLTEAREFADGQFYALALPKYEKLTRQFPRSPYLWLEYGHVALRLCKVELAVMALRRALDLAPNDLHLALHVAHQYNALGMKEMAMACYKKAATASGAIDPRIGLALILERNHCFDEARAVVEECLAIDPGDDQARYVAALLDHREKKYDRAERCLRDLITSCPRHEYVQYACRYELAGVFDHTGRYDEAMQMLIDAKAIVARLVDIEALINDYDILSTHVRNFTKYFNQDTLHKWAGAFPEQRRESVPSLAFLGGHPRSGTTLLEQILGAHPGIRAGDETSALTSALLPEYQKTRDFSCSRLNFLRRTYVKALANTLGGDVAGKLLLDKNPSPTAQLPIWLRVFPELRVIIALRDPRDVVLSCFFQNLPLNSTNANFLTFERLVKAYANLMDVWLAVRAWDGFSWVETRYEEIVSNTEKEARKVTEFLGLAWHEDQARFHEKSSKKQLFSPTYHDAAQPVYARAVGRWRAYEKYLAPILPALEPYCQAFGYS